MNQNFDTPSSSFCMYLLLFIKESTTSYFDKQKVSIGFCQSNHSPLLGRGAGGEALDPLPGASSALA